MLISVLVLIAGLVVYGILFLASDVPLNTSHPKIVLGTEGYDIKKLVAPKADGWKLEAMSNILTKTPLGPIICRYLLNSNSICT